MATPLHSVEEQALALPRHELRTLVVSLFSHLEGGEAERAQDVEAAWSAEITERLAEIERGDAVLVPSEEVFARAARLLKSPGSPRA